MNVVEVARLLRVLHIWNTAGVGSVIARYQAKLLGWKTTVLDRRSTDLFGKSYYGVSVPNGPLLFYLATAVNIMRYNVIHVHDLDKIVPVIKKVFPTKPVVLHYHGSVIRNRWNQRKRYWSQADAIIVATEDLLNGAPECAVYLPNPVDTQLFRPMPRLRRKGWALYMYSEDPKLKTGLERARSIAREWGLKLVVWHRRLKPIPHLAMPWFLNHFEYFIDHAWVPALSKNALEALACGLKVVRWDGKVLEGLPPSHKPEAVVKRLVQIYYKAAGWKHSGDHGECRG